eukprot:Hpha_TRINITY_DN11950_c0_g2::TRINITY_DN11950_c0_g2_i1::g.20469::m.20469
MHALLLLVCCSAAAEPLRGFGTDNKFGIGVYGSGSGAGAVPLAEQFPWALNLTGHGGRVLLYAAMTFSQNGNASSCVVCLPPPEYVAVIQQAYAMGLRPVVRLGQWPRTIRDFSDDTEHLVYTSLARAYRTFAAGLPLPPDGSSLEVIVHNELNGNSEWECSGEGYASTNQTAAEVAGCLRDTLAALRPLPRLLLSPAATAYTSPAKYPCNQNKNGTHTPVDYSKPTDIAFMKQMLRAVPDLYAHADFFNSHSYPFHAQPFSTPLGRAGSVHYRTQVNATGRPSLPVLITETGWSLANETEKAVSIVAAFQQEWLPDPQVVGVLPFLLASDTTTFAKWLWVLWNSTTAPSPSQQYNATRALRCRLGVGGMCP